MNPDNFQEAWRAQSSHNRLSIDPDLLLQEVQRNQRQFAATIFWRDVREVGIALLMIPVWLFLGARLSLPWAWYLTVPALVWIAGFMLADRMRHKRRPPELGEPLRRHVEISLAEVEQQIWLLRNVFWWYLLPPALSIAAFFGQIAWLARLDGWLTALVTTILVLTVGIMFAWIYYLNQSAVRTMLEPRRQELLVLLASLKEEGPAANSS
jgi:hypothetical protein